MRAHPHAEPPLRVRHAKVPVLPHPALGLAEAVVEATGALVLICDDRGRILLANPALQRFTARTDEALMGLPFWEVVVIPEEVEIAQASFGDTLAGGRSIPAEVDWLAAGGRRRRVELQTSVLTDADGAVYGAAFVGMDVTEHREREATVQRQAITDELTGVANRGMLFALLVEHLDRDSGTGCGLLFCDLDGFKNVNDEHGHACGDRLLEAVARRLTDVAGSDGVVARFGGDEFVLLFPGVDADRLAARARLVEQAVQAPFDVAGLRVQVGASVGRAIAPPGTEPDELVTRADSAMYAVKRRRCRPSTVV
jgi:cyclic di-GMP phosphodiesterase Gmr